MSQRKRKKESQEELIKQLEEIQAKTEEYGRKQKERMRQMEEYMYIDREKSRMTERISVATSTLVIVMVCLYLIWWVIV